MGKILLEWLWGLRCPWMCSCSHVIWVMYDLVGRVVLCRSLWLRFCSCLRWGVEGDMSEVGMCCWFPTGLVATNANQQMKIAMKVIWAVWDVQFQTLLNRNHFCDQNISKGKRTVTFDLQCDFRRLVEFLSLEHCWQSLQDMAHFTGFISAPKTPDHACQHALFSFAVQDVVWAVSQERGTCWGRRVIYWVSGTGYFCISCFWDGEDVWRHLSVREFITVAFHERLCSTYVLQIKHFHFWRKGLNASGTLNLVDKGLGRWLTL